MRRVLLALAGVFLLSQSAWSAVFTWSPSADAVAGYRLYYGTSSGNYTQSVSVGNVTQATVSNLTAGTTYYAAVTAYNSSSLESVKSNEVSFIASGGTTPPANVPPTVTLTSPTSGASFAAPATITLTASASDSDGTVSYVEFYSGTTRVVTVTTPPYTFNMSNVAAGTYSLTAKAYDNAGAVTTSAAVSVTVTTSTTANKAPTVSLTSPTNGATFVPPATITLTASASDSDGTISKVEFYNGSSLLATTTSSPYSVTFTGVPAGTYSITARAYDNAGAVTASAPSTVTVSTTAPSPTPTPTVNKAPTVSLTSPLNGAQLKAPATITLTASASDSDGTISKVEFYNGSSLLATDTASPYTVTFTGVPAGTYTVSARAYDNSGAATTSAAATVKVSP
ncbi:MAG: Ig-like domain-containing protein [Verrucomicrobia bacterium]|nr:Ig-like domain-containing protein [Verrucomicrobiota bacterium]